MDQATTFVGIGAHKKDRFVTMWHGQEMAPVTWQLANEPTAVRRLARIRSIVNTHSGRP